MAKESADAGIRRSVRALTVRPCGLGGRQDAANPFQSANAFSFGYRGSRCRGGYSAAPSCLRSSLGSSSRVFAAHGEAVELDISGASSRCGRPLSGLPTTARTTSRLGGTARHRVVRPLGACAAGRRAAQKRAAIFRLFLSSLAAAMFDEIYGSDEVLLIQYIGPLNQTSKLRRRLETRQSDLMLRPFREKLGYAGQRIWTDYEAIFRPRWGYLHRPHLELYSVGALPAMLHWDNRLCAFEMQRSQYGTFTRAGGIKEYRYANSRPEVLETQATHYRTVLGIDLTPTNYSISSFPRSWITGSSPSAIRPRRDLIVMCTVGKIGERWCYHCKKCLEYAIYSLRCGDVDPAFDYSRFLRSRRSSTRSSSLA